MQPLLGVLNPDDTNKIDPTPLEQANFVKCYEPGALYTDTCPCDTDCNLKVFELALVQAKVTYNRYGWHDPQGRFFVLKQELERHGGLDSYIEKVESQKIRVEPLVIRANAGDCVEIRLTNLLPEHLEKSPFQRKTITDIAGFHIHLVKFDTIISDGAANGWNNIAEARQYETLIERFFVNTELNTVFFHDHLFANSHQQHGVFGALIVEEAGATFHNIRTGKPLASGTKAIPPLRFSVYIPASRSSSARSCPLTNLETSASASTVIPGRSSQMTHILNQLPCRVVSASAILLIWNWKMVHLHRGIICIAPEVLNGMWNPACGEFSECSRRDFSANAEIYVTPVAVDREKANTGIYYFENKKDPSVSFVGSFLTISFFDCLSVMSLGIHQFDSINNNRPVFLPQTTLSTVAFAPLLW
ncbi:MAG: hypothetical protein ACI4SQ_06290 [Eubacterium sp.]